MPTRFLVTAIALASCCGLALVQAQTPPSGSKPVPNSAGTAVQGKADGTKKGFVGNISDLTEKNSDFRRVLYTGKNLQLVLMSLNPLRANATIMVLREPLVLAVRSGAGSR